MSTISHCWSHASSAANDSKILDISTCVASCMTTTSAIPLSNDDEAVILKSLPTQNSNSRTPGDVLDDVYEIQSTVETIKKNGYERIALQFPDELLLDAASVTGRVSDLCGGSIAFYILGDTSYGSCCVDEVAAEHVNADALVHYGRSCLSPTSRLPVIYVFGRLPLRVETIIEEVSNALDDHSVPILVVSDTTYISSQSTLVEQLSQSGYRNVISSKLNSTVEGAARDTDPSAMTTLPGRTYHLPESLNLSDIILLYVGPPSPTLTTTLMTHTSIVSKIYSYNPLKLSLSLETNQNVALRRRYATVQKARDAGVIGIVVGTLGVSRYLDLISHLRTMISRNGKKSYLFAMGKLNPSKMANFSEIDAFVLVACGENSLIESRDFYKPVVTPFELSLALRTRPHEAVPWNGNWITDFERVLTMPEPVAASDEERSDDDEEAPHFSLVTGKYSSSSKPMFSSLQTATDADSALTVRNSETTLGMLGGLFSPAAQHLNKRQHWAGLGTDHPEEQDQDEDSAVLTTGRSGVARGYDEYKHE